MLLTSDPATNELRDFSTRVAGGCLPLTKHWRMGLPIGAKSVELSGPSLRQEAVEHVVGAFGKLQAGNFVAPGRIEQAQLEFLSACAEKTANFTPQTSAVAPSGYGRPVWGRSGTKVIPSSPDAG